MVGLDILKNINIKGNTTVNNPINNLDTSLSCLIWVCKASLHLTFCLLVFPKYSDGTWHSLIFASTNPNPLTFSGKFNPSLLTLSNGFSSSFLVAWCFFPAHQFFP